MPIFVTCSTCGHQYQLSSRLAGKALRCKLCQGVIQCPPKSSATDGDSVDLLAVAAAAPAARRPAPQAAPAGNAYDFDSEPAAPRQAPPTSRHLQNAPAPLGPSQARRSAARNCFIMTGLGCLGAVYTGISAFVNAPNLPSREKTFYTIVILAICAGIVALSSVYLFCGLLIRKRGFASVIIALILASLQFLLFLAIVVLASIGAMLNGTNIAGGAQLGLQFLCTAVLGQLIYFLIQVLREPRPASL